MFKDKNKKIEVDKVDRYVSGCIANFIIANFSKCPVCGVVVHTLEIEVHKNWHKETLHDWNDTYLN